WRERHGDRHQQRGPRQHDPRAWERSSACCTRQSFTVGPHDRCPHGKFERRPGHILDENAPQDHRKARRSTPVSFKTEGWRKLIYMEKLRFRVGTKACVMDALLCRSDAMTGVAA